MAQPAAQPFAALGQRIDVISMTPSAVGANATSVQTVTVSGLDPIANQFITPGQFAFAAGAQGQTAGIVVVGAFCSAANTLSLVFQNTTGGSLTPVAGNYSFLVH